MYMLPHILSTQRGNASVAVSGLCNSCTILV